MSEAPSSSVADKDSAERHDEAACDLAHPTASTTVTDPQIDNGNKPSENSSTRSHETNQSEAQLIEEMRNFDNLLKMLSVYRDNPDLRGNPNDRHIEEIAKVLSNFIGDDPDNFLRDSDEEGEEAVQVNGEQNETSGSKQETPPADENNISSQTR